MILRKKININIKLTGFQDQWIETRLTRKTVPILLDCRRHYPQKENINYIVA